ncbi:protein yippee-like At4g27740 [Sesamum indicum]|uniref:Protein yippee-like n=1 Tax=Sesamum indicum TaxID=4182 RepID=A0A6I9TCB2_SESIN|nr:protein yippee-like At4g27740 [Sesamum indicum]
MGRPFLTEFDQPSPEYLMCKSCKTPIALPEEFHCFYPGQAEGVEGIVFQDRKIINVQVDKAVHHWQVGPHTVADTNCVGCGDNLGWKYIEIGGETLVLEKGMVHLRREKVQRRHGDQIINGDAREVVQIHT